MNETTKPEQVKDEAAAVAEQQEGPGASSEGQLNEPTKHKQVRISWQGHEEEVDEGIADLILALWVCGIGTLMSCQETEPGMAWIEFPTVQDALQFLNRVAVQPQGTKVPRKDTLYGRITGSGCDRDWAFDAYPSDWSEELERTVCSPLSGVDTEMEPSDFDFNISVYFPTSDIPLILAALTGSNAPPSWHAPDRRTQKEDATKQP